MTRTVRILMDYRPALRQRTGVGEYVHELAAALARQLPAGDELLLFSSSWRDRLEAGRVPGTRTVDRRIPVRVLNTAWHRFGWPRIEHVAGAVDIAHSMHPLLIPAAHAVQIATVYDLDFLDHPERTRAEIRRDYPRLAPEHARRADAIVTISAFTAGQITARLGVPADRVTVASPGAPAWKARARQEPQGPILFVGTLEPRKNVGTLLSAYARLRGMLPSAPPLVLAGASTPSAAAWLSTAAAPPLAGHVRHLGYVPAADRYALYASASMLVLPSYHEGFGLPALEAMTVGVPVVASDRGALPEVTGGAAVLVDADDADALAHAMRRYLSDPDAVAGAVGRGFERARAYSWDAAARVLRDLYQDALSRRRVTD
ncbi:MAG TPA: glycosyltransferase family 1 protein [Vicinamibacterales bacterium]|nr:glycosyltransferase family 1 protein [Vicinamibacterales bacterium]